MCGAHRHRARERGIDIDIDKCRHRSLHIHTSIYTCAHVTKKLIFVSSFIRTFVSQNRQLCFVDLSLWTPAHGPEARCSGWCPEGSSPKSVAGLRGRKLAGPRLPIHEACLSSFDCSHAVICTHWHWKVVPPQSRFSSTIPMKNATLLTTMLMTIYVRSKPKTHHPTTPFNPSRKTISA